MSLKKSLEGRIEKSEKKITFKFSAFQLKTKNRWKNMQFVYKFLKTAEFFRCLQAALDPLEGRVFETTDLLIGLKRPAFSFGQ